MKLPKIFGHIKYVLCTIIYSALVFQSCQINAAGLDYDATIPRKYPLFTVNYHENDTPESCRVDDFIKSCGFDGQCKTRKGLCGENLSSSFFTIQNWTELDGKYRANNGFDGFYSTNCNSARYVIVEDKGGEQADFNPANSQMSLLWQAKTVKKLSRNNKIDVSKHDNFLEDLSNGKVISFFTRTLYKDNRTPSRDRRQVSPIETVTASFGELQIGTSDRYIFRTEVSLLGSQNWDSVFQRSYIQNYQTDIHRAIFPPDQHCSLSLEGGYCLNQDNTERHNYSTLSHSSANTIYFR